MITACSTPDGISAQRSGASNRPAAPVSARRRHRRGLGLTLGRIGLCRNGFRSFGAVVGGRRLVPAAGAHRAPCAPVGLGVHLGLGEAELVAQPGAHVLERGGLGSRPRVPVGPVAAFQCRGKRFLVAPGDPVHPQPGVHGNRDQGVVVVVLFEVHLDRDVVGDDADDAVHSGDGCRVADQQVTGGLLVGHVEPGRAHQRHHGDGGAGLHGARPPRRRPGGVVQHDVDREPSGGGVGLRNRVGALEFGFRPVRVREPEPQPGGGFGIHVLEERGRGHADPHEMRCDPDGFDHRRGVVAGAEAAQHHTLEAAGH